MCPHTFRTAGMSRAPIDTFRYDILQYRYRIENFDKLSYHIENFRYDKLIYRISYRNIESNIILINRWLYIDSDLIVNNINLSFIIGLGLRSIHFDTIFCNIIIVSKILISYHIISKYWIKYYVCTIYKDRFLKSGWGHKSNVLYKETLNFLNK